MKCASSEEEGIWLSKFGKLISTRLCVITNRFREQDGGENAWEKAIQAVRTSGLTQVHVIVFCNKKEKIVDKVRERASPWKKVTVTDESLVLLDRLKKVTK